MHCHYKSYNLCKTYIFYVFLLKFSKKHFLRFLRFLQFSYVFFYFFKCFFCVLQNYKYDLFLIGKFRSAVFDLYIQYNPVFSLYKW